MTKLKDVLNWPEGAHIKDLTVRIRKAWPYEEREAKKGGTYGWIPMDVVDDTVQPGHVAGEITYKHGVRVDWKSPPSKDHLSLAGQLIVISTTGNATAEVHEVPPGYKSSGTRSIRAYSDSLTFPGGQPPTQQEIVPSAASQGQGRRTWGEWKGIYSDVAAFMRSEWPEDAAAAARGTGLAMMAITKGDCEPPPSPVSGEPYGAEPEPKPAEPEKDDEIPF